MSQPQTNPEALRRRLAKGVPDGYLVVYSRETFVVTTISKHGGTGKEVLRRPRKTVEKWRNPESTIAFAVRDAERRRR